MMKHMLTVGRYRRGQRTHGSICGNAGMQYGTSGQCSCGWRTRENVAPSSGGRAIVTERWAVHIEDASLTRLAHRSLDLTRCEDSGRQLWQFTCPHCEYVRRDTVFAVIFHLRRRHISYVHPERQRELRDVVVQGG